jgi:hypothetical protein
VLVALTRSSLSNGVFEASFWISWKSFAHLSADQVKTSRSILKSCILLAWLTALDHKAASQTARTQEAAHIACIPSEFLLIDSFIFSIQEETLLVVSEAEDQN